VVESGVVLWSGGLLECYGGVLLLMLVFTIKRREVSLCIRFAIARFAIVLSFNRFSIAFESHFNRFVSQSNFNRFAVTPQTEFTIALCNRFAFA
jgi:hypothetical protein